MIDGPVYANDRNNRDIYLHEYHNLYDVIIPPLLPLISNKCLHLVDAGDWAELPELPDSLAMELT